MKRLETSLREQSEKLVEAIDEVSLYNDLMIHDIHNANAGIMGYLELINIDGIDEKKRKGYIDRALKEVLKSSSIIKDVKVMSLARPVGEPKPVELAPAFQKVVERYRKEKEGKKPRIEMEIADLHVMADDLIEEGLIRVLENPWINGSDNVDLIRVEGKRDPSRSNIIPEPVHITITAEGEGLRELDVEKVFDRPKRTDLGSRGLGLYLVKKIIDRFGGMIWAEEIKKGKIVQVHILLKEAV
jgi:signal transduction histidine kinase